MNRATVSVKAGLRTTALSLLLFGLPAGAQPTAVAVADAEQVAAPATAPAIAPHWRLERGTIVRLMVLNEVNSRDSKAGGRFKLRVHEPIVVDGKELIPEGTIAWGEVTRTTASGAVGKAGSLDAKLLHIDLNGTPIRLSGERSAGGGGAADKVILGVIGFGVLGLLMKGNNATMKAGDLLSGYVADSMLFSASGPPMVVEPLTVPLPVSASKTVEDLPTSR